MRTSLDVCESIDTLINGVSILVIFVQAISLPNAEAKWECKTWAPPSKPQLDAWRAQRRPVRWWEAKRASVRGKTNVELFSRGSLFSPVPHSKVLFLKTNMSGLDRLVVLGSWLSSVEDFTHHVVVDVVALIRRAAVQRAVVTCEGAPTLRGGHRSWPWWSLRAWFTSVTITSDFCDFQTKKT